MSFRSKLLLACLPLALAPLAFFGVRARQEVTARLGAQDAARVAALADVIEEDLERESAAVAARLDRLAEAMAADNRLRRALLGGAGADRGYLLDYAGRAMQLAGLDLLRIQDDAGRVLSSGHFRNEYDTVDPVLPAAVMRAGGRGVLVEAPTASGSMLALARGRTLRVGARAFTVVGGIAVDERFLDRLARGTGLDVTLDAPAAGGAAPGRPADGTATASGGEDDGTAPAAGSAAGGARNDHPPSTSPADAVGAAPDAPAAADRDAPGAATASGYVREVTIPFAGPAEDTVARFTVRASTGPLDALRREMDRWLVAALAAAVALALLLAVVASARLSRPLADLAGKAGRLDLDRLDVAFATRRGDEIGALARVLDRMTHRLRASAARLRDAERRATIGEIARQVNHDIRNGLIPIRNVVSHLAQLARERPDELPAVFMERERTLESSVAYLHSLAANYARLSPRLDPRPCDLNAIVREVVRDAAGSGGTRAVAPADGRDAAGGSDGAGRVPRGEPDRRDTAGRSDHGRGAVPDDRGRPAARIATDLAPRLPPVHADPVALRRIVENLVLNALESLEDRGGRVVVSTRLDRANEHPRILLAVADTGRGMSAEERSRIFDDFYTTKPQGTGLGLSIVRRLVGDLGGRITVESEPGTGTRFTVMLPVADGPRRGG